MDYGHDLEFGTFLTPDAGRPGGVVERARLTERAGLDLVTVQDHPYQPRFLDAFTLLTWIAASTSRVRVFPNVANLPLRPPAVLARQVASLDRLSGGRAELGLGGGAFWDAIAANGGPRRTPAETVEALEEAIEVIHALWTGGPVRVDGRHYQVVGAKPGPAPAHDVKIYIGAYKPRMLRLAGRLADGWLPSLGYVQPEDLAGLNEIIDDAARAAGREPAAVRRLLNLGGTALDPERLAELAVRDGVSTFILGTDDPAAIEAFGAEVAPEVRALVAAHRRGEAPPAAEPVIEVSAPAGLGVTPTPDDGTRLSAERLWDESARPAAPAPDPDRAYTAVERATGQHLVDVHDHLRRELAEIRDLVERVEQGILGVGDARHALHTMTLRQNNWTLGMYCEAYCRLVTTHHTIEDISMFAYLRRAEPPLVPVIDRLEAEHRAIHDVIERVDEALVLLVTTDGDTKTLRAAVDLLTDTLLSHLSYEERSLVEPLARLGFQAS